MPKDPTDNFLEILNLLHEYTRIRGEEYGSPDKKKIDILSTQLDIYYTIVRLDSKTNTPDYVIDKLETLVLRSMETIDGFFDSHKREE